MQTRALHSIQVDTMHIVHIVYIMLVRRGSTRMADRALDTHWTLVVMP